MFGKLVLFAIIFSIILNYFIIPVLGVLAKLISQLGAEGALKHLLVVACFALLVFTLGVFVWLGEVSTLAIVFYCAVAVASTVASSSSITVL